ncbi:MAG: glycosyltransferase family 4 protein [Phycisphaerae bacterium]|nr:glycosyltransferase family 4 protein [Phycisphaerae bacterium]
MSTFELKTDTKWLLSLLGHVDRHRVDPSIACMYGGGAMRKRFESLGIETADFASPGEIDLSAAARIYRYIRSGRFDVVHTHLLRADLYAGLAARLAGTRAIVSTVYAIGPYRRSRRRRLDGLLDQLTRLWPTHLVAVSEAVRADCGRRLRWPASKVSVIHTGIEPGEYGACEPARRRIRAEWGFDQTAPLIVTVARLSYEKGLPTLIQAAGELSDRHPSAMFAIVGEGPMRSELAAQIDSLGLSETVRLIGFRTDVPDVLAAADVFCLPSRMEGMPNVLLEASAARVPIVATRVGGVPELIADNVTGLLVPPGNADALAGAIGRLIEDPSLRDRLGQAARRQVEQEFSVSAVAEKYQALHESLAAGIA